MISYWMPRFMFFFVFFCLVLFGLSFWGYMLFCCYYCLFGLFCFVLIYIFFNHPHGTQHCDLKGQRNVWERNKTTAITICQASLCPYLSNSLFYTEEVWSSEKVTFVQGALGNYWQLPREAAFLVLLFLKEEICKKKQIKRGKVIDTESCKWCITGENPAIVNVATTMWFGQGVPTDILLSALVSPQFQCLAE